MTIRWGISALSHDAAITVMEGDYILFAGHAERYSRIKNDAFLNNGIVNEALKYGVPDEIYWYERPFLKKTRQIFAGQWNEVFHFETPKSYLHENFRILRGIKIKHVDHHKAHAAAGFFTSPFQEATIFVVDGIGEWDTATVWKGVGNKLTKIKSIKYPDSLGIFYTAVTQRVGLKPLEDEYILMGMAAFGDKNRAMQLRNLLEKDFFSDGLIKFKKSLHRGILDWHPDLKEEDYSSLALAAQNIVEDQLRQLFLSNQTHNKNVVFMGGVALNCVANSKLAKICKNLWIMPNPGDAGSSLGAILAGTNIRAVWNGPYLGTDIKRAFDYDGAIKELTEGSGIIAIANGRAEFGPRALGNRSLIADPRGQHMKDKVNDIKQRQRFRPFAPMILQSKFTDYFYTTSRGITASPYMQFTALCKQPTLYPAICHEDGTSRVQTVTSEENLVIYTLLRMFYEKTGCPILLNTSLNVKGEPLVNDWEDALRFSDKYKVKLF